jgi:hypothetical protein
LRGAALPAANDVERVDDEGQARLDPSQLRARCPTGGLGILRTLRTIQAERVSEPRRHGSVIPPPVGGRNRSAR